MINVLITGGCGFIGSNLTEYLIKNTDWHINILDNLSTGSLKDIKSLNSFDERITFYQGDITNIQDINRVIKNCDYIINLAAQTSVIDSINDPLKDQEINIKGILNLLITAVKNNIRKFIQASSSAVLGKQEMPINEVKVPRPLSPYGASKLGGESFCSAFSSSFGLKCVVLRFSNVYGPKSYNKGSVIPKFIKKIINGKNLEIYGDGNQTRDFIHVNDVCSAVYLSIINNTEDFELFQIGSGMETSINSLLEVLSHTFKDLNLKMPKIEFKNQRPGEIINSYSDITRAKDFGIQIKYNLTVGLEDTIKWYLKEHN